MPILPVIDPSSIQTLRDLSPGDNDVFLREMVGLFLEDTPLRIAELETGLKSADGATFTRAAHSIKGSAGNLGARQLAAVAARVEDDARTKPLAQLGPSIEDIRAEFSRANDELQGILAAGPGGPKG